MPFSMTKIFTIELGKGTEELIVGHIFLFNKKFLNKKCFFFSIIFFYFFGVLQGDEFPFFFIFFYIICI